MSASGTKKILRDRRKAAKKELMERIQLLPDAELRNMAAELGREMNQQANILNEIRSRLDGVRLELQRRTTVTKSGIHISDHAVVRYLERHMNMDMAAVREAIVGMAERAMATSSSSEPDQYARRKDDQTGMIVGMNEISQTVTTVFSPTENEFMDPV